MDPVAHVVDKDRIVDLVTRLFVATDARLTPQQVTDAWDARLRPLEASTTRRAITM
jgi:hypothetical protein